MFPEDKAPDQLTAVHLSLLSVHKWILQVPKWISTCSEDGETLTNTSEAYTTHMEWDWYLCRASDRCATQGNELFAAAWGARVYQHPGFHPFKVSQKKLLRVSANTRMRHLPITCSSPAPVTCSSPAPVTCSSPAPMRWASVLLRSLKHEQEETYL